MKFVLTIIGGASWSGRAPVATEHASRAAAEAALAQYVRANWQDEDLPLEDLPLEDDTLIAAYFAGMDEDYEILEVRA